MCGFISIFGPPGSDVVRDALSGLLAIQHRGQDAAGVVAFDKKFETKKGLGLVREVFQQKHLKRLAGPAVVAHVRYPTVGTGSGTDVQPFTIDFPLGIAMAHNGNVTNFQQLKRTYFRQRNIHLHSDCDLEAVLYVFAGALVAARGSDPITPQALQAAVAEVFRVVKGAYSVVGYIAGAGMFAFRDPYGIKPIIMGERHDPDGPTFAVASESVVLDVAGFERHRDLAAGELLWIDEARKPQFFQVGDRPHRPCIFEYMYFARPDSTLDGISVYEARLESGKRLAAAWRETGLEVDAVMPVPESARTAAQTMAEELGVPYREGLVKNRYVGRTFIMANDELRRDSVRDKLNPIRSEFEGKRVLIVDDSIVRGHTSRQLVKIARQMGAAKVYLASYSPPLLHPCLYGIDMSTKRDFIALDRSVEQVAEELGCDYLLFQTIDDMVAATNAHAAHEIEFCKACFAGEYPTGDVTQEMLHDIEHDRLSAAGTDSGGGS
ncbi:MAG: amidophosphoribosyltransferase [Planctomycetes bacterium]|nr:amidophosphoribosyltransferase [Planctomycetota bacterium]MCB9870222.1 amidophosphoribosyltransferase [Planctomycetota bacterium]MCB9888198.1 amidophosphoribosyltransferase [Planctomycetota bacterium]